MTRPGGLPRAALALAALVAVAVAPRASAADEILPSATLTATLGADGATITGCLVLQLPERGDPAAVTWVDPLDMPEVWHDLDLQRTFPGPPRDGAVRWGAPDAACPGLPFTTTLPRRWGDTGATAQGTFANGGWYPQPLMGGRLPALDWDATLTLPPGVTGALGDHVGGGTLRWSGRADRVSLAAVRRGVVTALDGPTWSVDLLTSGPPRPGLRRHLPAQLAMASAGAPPWRAAVVEAPHRRRLSSAGAGLAYVSDRAWRVFPWFSRLHHPAPTRAVLSAAAPQPDASDRALVGAGLGLAHQARLSRQQSIDLVRWTAWLPAVDAALYDQEMPFLDDVFRRVVPSDRVPEDLTERLDPRGPALAAAAQLADVVGVEPVADVARAMLAGAPRADALTAAGLPTDALDAARRPAPLQDYTLRVEGADVTVERVALPSAPPEPVVLRVDGRREVWPEGVAPGASVTRALPAPPRRVSLDPDRHLAQTLRVGEEQPARLRWTLTGQISAINISQAYVDASAVLTVRRSDDTRNRARFWLITDQRAWLTGRASYTRSFGPLLRGATRRHQLSVSAEGAWLNPTFSDLPGAKATLGGSVSYAWDDREYSLFPMRGTRATLHVSGGGTPDTGQTWVSGGGSLIHLESPHPRHVLATRLSAGGAITDIPQRRSRFGGEDGVRGIPDLAVQTEVQASGSLEWRVAPLRQLSVPLGPLYLEEVQLLAGVDVGVGLADGALVSGVGLVGGVGLLVENLGLSPGAITLTVGYPAWWRGFDLPTRRLPVELYLGWGWAY